jgi:hypothetical protein
MKILATTAISLFVGLGRIAGCDSPQPEPAAQTTAAPSAHQTAYGVTLDAYPSCAVFNATLWNSNNTARTARIKVDGSYHSTLYAAPDGSDSETIYFPNNSGDHTVSVFWAGGTSNYTVWTNCAP